jgi:hypothetical protein
MELFITILVAVFGILQIILFFKLWGMTNNVARIKEYVGRIDERANNQVILNEASDNHNEDSIPDWTIGSRVVRKATEKQMKIIGLNSNGTFVCTTDDLIAGSYRRDELIPWSEWLEIIKK